MEEYDGQDSSVVRRPIEIMSMNDTIGAATVRRPLKQPRQAKQAIYIYIYTMSEPGITCTGG